MNLNWKNVRPYAFPIQTTKDDLIFNGHGAYQSDGDTTTVPDRVELWLLAPIGASISYDTGWALANMKKISRLDIKNPGFDILFDNMPMIYPAGSKAPNLILPPDRRITIKPFSPAVLGVKEDTKLSELWKFIKPDKTIRCYWAACSDPEDTEYAVVYHK
jgi:hypothetical protein